MAWTSTVLSSSPFEVVIKSTEAADPPAVGYITWAQLADLFEHPDTINAPSAPQMASVTGERKHTTKTDLIVKSINSSHSNNQARTSSISWENSGGQTHMWGLPTDPMFKEFGTLLKFEGDLHATNAVKLEVVNNGMEDVKTFDMIITFGVD